jgi:hypothetical protein
MLAEHGQTLLACLIYPAAAWPALWLDSSFAGYLSASFAGPLPFCQLRWVFTFLPASLGFYLSASFAGRGPP